MAKYYAVRVGAKPGVYTDWASCEAQVKGFPKAEYKSFKTRKEAEDFVIATNPAKQKTNVAKNTPYNTPTVNDSSLKHHSQFYVDTKNAASLLKKNGILESEQFEQIKAHITELESKRIDIYVDGSYNSVTNEYGYGVFMDDGAEQRILYGKGVCEADGRNVEGEVAAASHALLAAYSEHKYLSCTIYHDYNGIGFWGTGKWSTNKEYTRAYAELVQKLRNAGLDISFKHIKGHSGDEGNEIVDKLAKIGCDIPLTAVEKKALEKYKDVPGYPNI